VIIRDKIRNRVISARLLSFRRTKGIERSEGEVDGGGGPSTRERLARIDSKAGTFQRWV